MFDIFEIENISEIRPASWVNSMLTSSSPIEAIARAFEWGKKVHGGQLAFRANPT